MKPFVHKTFIGNFFDVLHGAEKNSVAEGSPFLLGGTKRRGAVIAILSGDLTLDRLPELASSLHALQTSLVKLIVLDMSRVTDLSPNAAGGLVNYLAGVEGRGKRLILFRPSPAVLDCLAGLDLTHLFQIQRTEEELLLDLPD